MSNEPNQPAEDAPKPESAAAGQAGPDAKPGATDAAQPADQAAATPGEGSVPDPVPAAPVETPPGETAPGPERYLIAPDGEERELPSTGGGGHTTKILIAAGVVLLLVVGFFGIRYFVNNNAVASAGDCVSLTGQSDNRADVKNLDCGEDKASYKVGKVLEAADAVCPEEGLYTEVSPTGNVGDGYKLCLLPNMTEGSCYKPDDGTGFVKGECTGPETIKVTKVIKDSTDLTQCPDSAGMSYPEPAVTYCLAPAEV